MRGLLEGPLFLPCIFQGIKIKFNKEIFMRVDMKRVLAFLSAIVLALGLVACKSGYSSKISDVKSALEETCHAEKAESEQYDKMVDAKYPIQDVADDFKDGAYAEVKSKDRTFFAFHTVVDHSDIESVFKYVKADPASKDKSGMVANMEVLVIQFDNSGAANRYFDDIMNARKKTSDDFARLDKSIKNEFVEKKEYFAFACESEFMTYNVYASIDGSTVMYAFVEGPNAETLKSEYYAFMSKMECSIIKL